MTWEANSARGCKQQIRLCEKYKSHHGEEEGPNGRGLERRQEEGEERVWEAEPCEMWK